MFACVCRFMAPACCGLRPCKSRYFFSTQRERASHRGACCRVARSFEVYQRQSVCEKIELHVCVCASCARLVSNMICVCSCEQNTWTTRRSILHSHSFFGETAPARRRVYSYIFAPHLNSTAPLCSQVRLPVCDWAIFMKLVMCAFFMICVVCLVQ